MPNNNPLPLDDLADRLLGVALEGVPVASRDDSFFLALAMRCIEEVVRPGSPAKHDAAKAFEKLASMRAGLLNSASHSHSLQLRTVADLAESGDCDGVTLDVEGSPVKVTTWRNVTRGGHEVELSFVGAFVRVRCDGDSMLGDAIIHAVQVYGPPSQWERGIRTIKDDAGFGCAL